MYVTRGDIENHEKWIRKRKVDALLEDVRQQAESHENHAHFVSGAQSVLTDVTQKCESLDCILPQKYVSPGVYAPLRYTFGKIASWFGVEGFYSQAGANNEAAALARDVFTAYVGGLGVKDDGESRDNINVRARNLLTRQLKYADPEEAPLLLNHFADADSAQAFGRQCALEALQDGLECLMDLSPWRLFDRGHIQERTAIAGSDELATEYLQAREHIQKGVLRALRQYARAYTGTSHERAAAHLHSQAPQAALA